MLPQPDCPNQPQNDPLHERLLVQGEVTLRQDEPITVYLQRGLKVESSAGKAVGFLAALILDGQRQIIDQLLLGQLPDSRLYRYIPLEMVDTVCDGIIRLTIQSEDVQELAIYRATLI